jgi:hypothetical protein
MTLYEWWDKTPKSEINRLRRNLMRRKFYVADWKEPNYKYKILDRKAVGNYVILLCENSDEYVIYTDLLMPKSIPSDAFCASLKDAKSIFKEVISRTKLKE